MRIMAKNGRELSFFLTENWPYLGKYWLDKKNSDSFFVYWLEAVKIHYEGHRKGWALEIKTFLGP